MIRYEFTGRKNKDLQQFLDNSKIDKYLISDQVHSDKIYILKKSENICKVSGYDALITAQRGIALIIKSADCVPLLLYDDKKNIIAAVHAGRVGTELEIAKKTVAAMKENFDCNSQDIKAVIGPSICKNCYPCDLWQENKRQLLAAEIPIENLKLTKLCTACNANDQYYSYRKNNKTSLRNYSYILLL